MITQVIGTSTAQQTHFLREKMSAASRLGPIRRKDLWLRVLARTEPLSHLARNYGLSRKFLYRQAAKASDALDEAFADIAARFKVPLFLVMPFANCRVWIKTFRGIGNGKRSCAKNSQADFTLSRRPSVRCSARRPEPVPLSRTSTVACGTTSSYADISATIICICCVSFSTTAASGVATDPNASAKAPQNC